MGDTDNAEFANKIWLGETAPGGSAPLGNLQAVSRLFDEVWNQGNLNAVNQLIDVNFRQQNNLNPGSTGGPEGYKESVSSLRAAFPDLAMKLEQVLEEDERIAVRLRMTGTHKGVFMGMPPTNKPVAIGGMVFLHLKAGKVTEAWSLSDLPGLMGQLSGEAGERR